MSEALNVAESFSNYRPFAYHFRPVTIIKAGKDDYVACYGNEYPDSWVQRGTKEYINGWLYGAVQTACGQIRKKEESETGDQEGICPVCGGQIQYCGAEMMDDGGVNHWECPDCGATGDEGYDEVFDGHHYNVQDADGHPIPGREIEVEVRTEKTLRFSDADIDHAMKRLHLTGETGRAEAAEILTLWDRGHGDVDDVIDEYEDANEI